MLIVVATVTSACSGRPGLFRQYEYEEEMYLSLDGTANMYVNSSIAALDALRGASFDTRPTALVDRNAVRAYFSTPITHVRRVATSRRSNRQFVHLRIDVDDIRRLPEAVPFAWSSYRFDRSDDSYLYRQTVGPGASKDVGHVGWNGREVVAFRLHLPSKISFHNTRRDIERGNILVWEQTLADRLRGAPLTLEARMETQSILYHALWLFGSTFVAVAITFALVIWWVLRRATPSVAEAQPR